jgi:hypothetical protein
MTVAEIKSEINNVVDHIPENALEDALKLLKDFQDQTDRKAKRAKNVKMIIADNHELLQELAK